MEKNIKKIFILTTLIFLGMILLWGNSAFATGSLTITFENTPLFTEADLKPGDIISRWVKVTNNTGETKSIITEAINYPNPIPDYDLSRALTITIKKDGTDLYGGSTGQKFLYQFYQAGEVYLSDVNNGDMSQYYFVISFPYESGNEWQGNTTSFDILVGSLGEEGGGGVGGGTTGGGSAGGALPQGLTIINESVVTTNLTGCQSCSITINWNTNYFSTSRVVYSKEGESHNFDLYAPNYGYTYSKEGDNSGDEKVTVHSVTITGLSPNTNYYFRCESHASPPTITMEFNFVTAVSIACQNQNTNETGGENTGGGTGEGGGNSGGPVAFNGGQGSSGGNEFTAGGTEGGTGEQGENGNVNFQELNNTTGEQTGNGTAGFLSGGLASILDVFGKIFDKINLSWFVILLLIIILVLFYLFFKKRKKENQ